MATKYLTKFNTETEYNSFINSNECPYVNVSYIQATDENKYYKEADELMVQPFTMHIDSSLSNDESIPLVFWVQTDPTNSGVTSYCRYRINNGQWNTFTFTIDDNPNKGDENIRLYKGDTVQIICKSNWFNAISVYHEKYDFKFTISGNIMSLFWGDDYIYAPANKLPFPQIPYDTNGTKIEHIHIVDPVDAPVIDASDLWLPTKNLPEGIFMDMFKNCTDLTAVPDIKAKYLPKNACNGMFMNCTSLTDMPLILAETVEESALDSMFNGCTSLVNTTQLHIKKIYTGFGNWMFAGCTSLVTAPVWNEDVELNNMTYTWNWFEAMFNGCTSLEDMSTWNIRFNKIDAYNSMLCHGAFGGCTSLTNTPYWGLTYDTWEGCYLEMMFDPAGQSYPPIDTIYFLMTTGEITDTGHTSSLAQTGTVYLKHDSRYLPDGDLYGQLPCNLPAGWTVAEYVAPSN